MLEKRLAWDEEWEEELKLVRDRSKSLTEIHVFVLAHVVRRPIIVYRCLPSRHIPSTKHHGHVIVMPIVICCEMSLFFSCNLLHIYMFFFLFLKS